MLQSLYIKNYVLIDSLEIKFEDGFSVITGETGAGKSILLGALSLLLGQRADTRVIRTNEKKCVIEANFRLRDESLLSFFEKNDMEYEKGQCIIRREIHANGKSRVFINDTPSSLQLLKELSLQLVDIHSQHRNLFLTDSQFQLNAIDIMAGHKELLAIYSQCYDDYLAVSKQLNILHNKAQKGNEEIDYITFQYQQLEELKLQNGEQEELEQEQETLSHSEDIKTALYKAYQVLADDGNNILSGLKESINEIRSVEKYMPQLEKLTERLESNLIDLKDIAVETESAQDSIEFNPERLNIVNERLDLLYSLQKKHHVGNIEELIEIREQFRKQLEQINSFDEDISEAEKEKEEKRKKLIDCGKTITENRKKTIPKIEKELTSTLKQLGMPNIRFSIDLMTQEPAETGMDVVQFLFSANKNVPERPISEIASGGEIARLMLSIKALIAGAISLPTIIFDEIDTGVSGEIAGKMAQIMQQMGKTMQVITITHLPQIASKGERHFKVYKEDTEKETITNIRLLTKEERINELAGMLSSGELNEAAINNARSLLG